MRAAALLVAGLLGVAACGDDSDDVSKAEYLEQANSILCEGAAEIQEESAALFADESAPPEEATMIDFVDFVEANVEAQIAGVTALEPPEDLRDEVDSIWEQGRAAIAEFANRAKADPENFDQIEDETLGDFSDRAGEFGYECV